MTKGFAIGLPVPCGKKIWEKLSTTFCSHSKWQKPAEPIAQLIGEFEISCKCLAVRAINVYDVKAGGHSGRGNDKMIDRKNKDCCGGIINILSTWYSSSMPTSGPPE